MPELPTELEKARFKQSIYLFLKILFIDKEAFKYTMTRLNDIPAFEHDRLGGLFVWENTPQGWYYWAKLERKIENGFP